MARSAGLELVSRPGHEICLLRPRGLPAEVGRELRAALGGRRGFGADAAEAETGMPTKTKEGMRGLEHENDPRGGRQSPDYRTADPRDLVVEGETVMSGPAGAPQEREPELRSRKRKRKR